MRAHESQQLAKRVCHRCKGASGKLFIAASKVKEFYREQFEEFQIDIRKGGVLNTKKSKRPPARGRTPKAVRGAHNQFFKILNYQSGIWASN